MNGQSNNQSGGDFAKTTRCVSIEMTGRASRTNMMNMFADKKKRRIAEDERQQHRPGGACAKTLRENREQRHAEKGSCRETDEGAKRLVFEMQCCADGSTCNSENVGGDDLPERVSHLDENRQETQ